MREEELHVYKLPLPTSVQFRDIDGHLCDKASVVVGPRGSGLYVLGLAGLLEEEMQTRLGRL